jgi:(2Fe-2S) ferredoxin
LVAIPSQILIEIPKIPISMSVRSVLVCQNRTCKKQGANAVLAAFKASPIDDVTVVASGCLGQCGNGPMVLILPDLAWYSGVTPGEVPLVVKNHLLENQLVSSMLYSKFHSSKYI